MAFPVLSSDEPAVTSLSSLCSWSRVAKVEDTNKSVRGIICNMVNYFTELCMFTMILCLSPSPGKSRLWLWTICSLCKMW